MEITVKQLKEALNKIDNDNEKVYIEAGFGCSDIHVLYKVAQLENGRVILYGDGHCATDDRDGTDFDFNIKENDLINEVEKEIDGRENIQKADRYRKALEEIEKICLEDTYTFADGTQVRYDSLDDILNIINKAKGEQDD